MTKEEVMSKLTDIFQDVMDNDEIELSDASTSDDIEEWDSLTHIQLVVAIEKAFGVKLSSKEIASWANVGEMADALVDKAN